MSRIEDLLRAATRDTAAEVEPGSIPGLDLHAVSRRGRVFRAVNIRLPLRPLLIGAAVALIAAATVMIRTQQSAGPAGPDAVPPYYIALVPNDPGPIHQTATLELFSTYSGEVLATVKPPAGYGTFDSIAGTSNPTTFLVAALEKTKAPSLNTLSRFYLLHYQPGTGKVSLSPLRVPPIALLDTASLSPDGRYLAEVTDAYLRIINLRTGAQRTWQAGNSAYLTFSRDPHDAAWTSDDKTMSLIWSYHDGQVRLLHPGSPGNDISHGSRRLMWGIGSDGFYCISDPFIIANGSVVACGGVLSPVNISASMEWSKPPTVTTGFAEFSAATGRLITILDPERQRLPVTKVTQSIGGQRQTSTVVDFSKLPSLLWSNSDASTLIGTRNGKAFVFHDGSEQPIPLTPAFKTQLMWSPMTGVAW